MNTAPQKKKDQRMLARSVGINFPAHRPDPENPGGLGAEESGVDKTGPTQCLFLAIQRGVGLAEIRRYYDLTNFPVTLEARDATIK
ncbi:MAG: hypothetical protein BGP05_09580 [Rhizobiales bacterium 62-47]|nr:MAG: hypothetical protein BGP05_09580 [Rhizobiales bacterium 62-47]